MRFYTQEKWDWLPSTLDDARTTDELYKRLSNLGFMSYSTGASPAKASFDTSY